MSRPRYNDPREQLLADVAMYYLAKYRKHRKNPPCDCGDCKNMEKILARVAGEYGTEA